MRSFQRNQHLAFCRIVFLICFQICLSLHTERSGALWFFSVFSSCLSDMMHINWSYPSSSSSSDPAGGRTSWEKLCGHSSAEGNHTPVDTLTCNVFRCTDVCFVLVWKTHPHRFLKSRSCDFRSLPVSSQLKFQMEITLSVSVWSEHYRTHQTDHSWSIDRSTETFW